MTPIIESQALTKRFGEVQALDALQTQLLRSICARYALTARTGMPGDGADALLFAFTSTITTTPGF